mgnify:CR=1 FL=1
MANSTAHKSVARKPEQNTVWSRIRRIACLALALGGVGQVMALPGDLDTSFGSAGKMDWPALETNSAREAIPLADGRMMFVLYTNVYLCPFCPNPPPKYITWLRYRADGSLDSSFGQNGRISAPASIAEQGVEYGFAAAYPDGRVVAKLRTDVIVRWNADGSIDSNFITELTTLRSTGFRISKLLPIRDGRLLLVGYFSGSGGQETISLVMLKVNGAVDPSFGDNGVVLVSEASSINSVVVSPDGQIMTAGVTRDRRGITVGRFNADGTPDTGFAQDGTVTTYIGRDGRALSVPNASDTDIAASGQTIVLQPDGRALVGGQVCRDLRAVCMPVLLRYLANGQLDGSFENGMRSNRWGSTMTVRDIYVRPDGKILTLWDRTIVRFNANGSHDTGYGDNGMVRILSDGSRFLPDGKLFGYGSYIYRYLTDNADQGVVPCTGLWVIDAEKGGPGRGFQIEVQRNLLMMVVNGYEASGAATFHVAGGSYQNGSFSGQLQRYAGGSAIGGSVQAAHLAGSAGQVSLYFSDATHGTIALPGESPKTISKFDFGVPPKTEINVQPLPGLWVIHSEMGAPGRGFMLESQGNHMVMVFDTYTAQGEPTFYFASGPLRMGTTDSVTNWATPLESYAGGPYFGGLRQTAHFVGSIGFAGLFFANGSDSLACLWLPGDIDCRMFSKFDFGLQ